MRFEDWDRRLHDYMLARHQRPFVWGETDCLLTVCDAIAAMTGTDPGAHFRGRYASESAARAVVAIEGYPNLEALVAAVAEQQGFGELPVKRAGRGDLVLLDDSEGPAWGIVHLDGRNALFASEQGLKFRPLSEVRRAWRVA